MENLKRKSNKRILNTPLTFNRYLLKQINFKNRLICITGARGTGKTTLVLQHLKMAYPDTDETLYVLMDDIFFVHNTLSSLAEDFIQSGGKILVLDEVHKYPGWSREIKNIYDFYPELKIIYTGSSLLELYKSEVDLSRRTVVYNLHELSLREYIELYHKIKIPAISLKDILAKHIQISNDISQKIKPVKYLKEYFQYGSYPFITEGKEEYPEKLTKTIWQVLEVDLPGIIPIEYGTIIKLKKMLYLIGSSAPFIPNIKELAEKIGASRDQTLRFIFTLEKAMLLFSTRPKSSATGYLTKPEKIYLHNSNLLYSLSDETTEIGTARETFFANQVSLQHKINHSEKADFLVSGMYTFEIGGKNKKTGQIRNIQNSFIAADNIETGNKNTIPLWLFGFLY
ncbi:MAG: ATP-binding protein [Bacteroidia bacterium]|nr:ATP-binding protein [Bacteroidia bacterium]